MYKCLLTLVTRSRQGAVGAAMQTVGNFVTEEEATAFCNAWSNSVSDANASAWNNNNGGVSVSPTYNVYFDNHEDTHFMANSASSNIEDTSEIIQTKEDSIEESQEETNTEVNQE
jgi:hypothetical protein